MKIKIIKENFAVCKIQDLSKVNYNDEFYFIGKTDEELSLVCMEKSIPSNTTDEDREWRCFRIEGTLDFSLVGILAKIATLLAENKISIFAVSTYNTDYVLVKSHSFNKAINILHSNGYEVIE